MIALALETPSDEFSEQGHPQGKRTLGQYAVLDYGFFIPQRDGLLHRAGASLQQTHSRSLLPFTFIKDEEQLEIEFLLRTRGWSSISRRKMALLKQEYNLTHDCHAISIQGTRDGHLADLDQFRLWDFAWDRPLCLWANCFPQCLYKVDNTTRSYVKRVSRRFTRGLEIMTTISNGSFLKDQFHQALEENYERLPREDFDQWIFSLVEKYKNNLRACQQIIKK